MPIACTSTSFNCVDEMSPVVRPSPIVRPTCLGLALESCARLSARFARMSARARAETSASRLARERGEI